MDAPLTLVVPAFNEEDSLKQFLPELIRKCKDHGWNLIVVDDCSTDRTRSILESWRDVHGFRFIRHKVNRGYGGALKSGIRAARTPLVITLDADGQHRLEDVARLADCQHRTGADLVIGSRAMDWEGHWLRQVGKCLIRSVSKLLMSFHIKDLNSGMKLYRTALAKRYLHLCPDSMAFSDTMALIFLSRKHLVSEEPIEVRRRFGGTSTITVKTAFQTLYQILNIIMLFHPTRIFIPLSIFSILAGAAWSLQFVLSGNGLSVGGLLALLTGLLLFCMGLIAEQLALIRQQQSRGSQHPLEHTQQNGERSYAGDGRQPIEPLAKKDVH